MTATATATATAPAPATVATATTTTVATAPVPTTTTTTNVFNQCIKATNDFLLRDSKERMNVTKRYLEPLTDVINGVPHK